MATQYQVNTILTNGAVINSGVVTLPTANIATSTEAGLVMPVSKTADMTQEVGVDAEGKLYTTPGSGGDYIPLANITNNGSVVLGTNMPNIINNYTVQIGSNINSVSPYSIAIGSTAFGKTDIGDQCIGIGHYVTANGSWSIALGGTARAYGSKSIAIGSGAQSAVDSISIGVDSTIAATGVSNSILISTGGRTNCNQSNSLQIWDYKLLDKTNGLIPDERLSSNIARADEIPKFTDNGDGTISITANGVTMIVTVVGSST